MVEFEKFILGERSKGYCLDEFWMVDVELFKSEEIINSWIGLEEKFCGID